VWEDCMRNMLRKYVTVVLTIIASLMIIGTTYAQEVNSDEFADARRMTDVRTVLTDNTSKVFGITRGRVLSSAEMELTNKGGGEADVYVEVLCHETVSKLRMKIYVEKWNESGSKWSTVDSKDYIWTSEEYGDDLSMAVVNYNVQGLSKGKYRLRGSFSARGIESGISEAWTHSTEPLIFD